MQLGVHVEEGARVVPSVALSRGPWPPGTDHAGLATLVLDGELWTRSPTDYCHYCPEVVNLPRETASDESTNLRRSLVTHDWAASLRDSTPVPAGRVT